MSSGDAFGVWSYQASTFIYMPVHEYAIMYSFAMGRKNWPYYKEKLNKHL